VYSIADYYVETTETNAVDNRERGGAAKYMVITRCQELLTHANIKPSISIWMVSAVR
jgi:hypothetical protein